MAVIYVLLVAHFVADFLCQSDWIALNKSKRWDALAAHVMVYVGVVGLFVAASQPPSEYPYDTLMSFALWMGVNSAAHFVQDAITSRITSRLWFVLVTPTGEAGKIWHGDGDGKARMEPLYAVEFLKTRHWFFVAIGFDQLLHYITLFVTAGWWLQ